MTDTLTNFLRQAASRPFRLGEWDCGLWLADWYMIATGKPDPAALIRGVACYRDDDIVQMVRRLARLDGLARTRNPLRGDIGLIRLGYKAHGSIFTGIRWAVLGRGSIGAVTGPRIIAAWRVE